MCSISHQELISSNLKLVSSHLDLVSLITLNLKRVTHPLDSSSQSNQIDYHMLRQLEQALAPPQPLRAIEYHHDIRYPWQNQPGEDPPMSITRSTTSIAHDGPDDRDERRYILSQRLENLAMRRVETIDTISTIQSRGRAERSVDPLISRLQDIRLQILEAVGIQPPQSDMLPHSEYSSSEFGPENALLHELEAYIQAESRIQREILHPGHLTAQAPQLSTDSANEDTSYLQASPRSSGSSFPEVAETSSTSPLGTSPMSRFLGIPNNNSNHYHGHSPSPHGSDDSPGHNRALSTTSTSSVPSIRVDPSIPVYL